MQSRGCAPHETRCLLGRHKSRSCFFDLSFPDRFHLRLFLLTFFLDGFFLVLATAKNTSSNFT